MGTGMELYGVGKILDIPGGIPPSRPDETREWNNILVYFGIIVRICKCSLTYQMSLE